VLGALSDRYGRRPVLLGSLAATTGWYLLIALGLEVQSLPLLLAACLGAGLSEANVVVAQGPSPTRPVSGIAPGSSATCTWRSASRTRPGPTSAARRESVFAAFANLSQVVLDPRLRSLYLVNFLLYLAMYGFFRSSPMYMVDEFDLGVSRESELIAYLSLPFIVANLGLVGWLAARLAPRTMVVAGALAFAVTSVVLVLPDSSTWLWATLPPVGLAIAVVLPATAAMISLSARADEQGHVLGNNQGLQVGAEALAGLLGGAIAAIVVKLPLFVWAGTAVVAVALLAGPAATRRAAIEPKPEPARP
jgi:DHA1 family tetracycline resistance protein-like MFS transporter